MPVTVYPAPASTTDNDPVPHPRSTTSEGGAGSTERNNMRQASRTAGSRSPWSASSSNDDAAASQKPAVSSMHRDCRFRVGAARALGTVTA